MLGSQLDQHRLDINIYGCQYLSGREHRVKRGGSSLEALVILKFKELAEKNEL